MTNFKWLSSARLDQSYCQSNQSNSLQFDTSFDDAATSDRAVVCSRINKLNPGSLEYRGDHLYEAQYALLQKTWFASSAGRKKVLVVIRHLSDEKEVKFDRDDRTTSFWTGSPDEPVVFVVAVGSVQAYTAEVDVLLRLAGSPSRLVTKIVIVIVIYIMRSSQMTKLV